MGQPPVIFDDFYEMVGELGRGTTGTVYEAWHTRLDRRVAVKVPDLTPDAERTAKAERFLRECRALACLTGGSACRIPRLYVVTEHPPGHPYYVRELVEGSTLEQWAASRSSDLLACLSILAEVARVVQRVHEQGFAHRNLSPANVLVAPDSTPRLIGFGRVGALAGSDWLPPGAEGVPAAEDKRDLHELVAWLFAAYGRPVPPRLDRALWEAATPGEVGAAILRHLGEAAVPGTAADPRRQSGSEW